jgi:hypothetical protein
MSHVKQVSSKRKRSINAVPVLSAAGLSLSLASAASAAAIGGRTADTLTQNIRVTHEITLSDEEILDVSLATLYVFDNERTARARGGARLTMGGGGCGIGMPGGSDEGCGSCTTNSYSAPSLGWQYGNPPSNRTKTTRKYATKRRHVPK